MTDHRARLQHTKVAARPTLARQRTARPRYATIRELNECSMSRSADRLRSSSDYKERKFMAPQEITEERQELAGGRS
jgi:hypothetical protein